MIKAIDISSYKSKYKGDKTYSVPLKTNPDIGDDIAYERIVFSTNTGRAIPVGFEIIKGIILSINSEDKKTIYTINSNKNVYFALEENLHRFALYKNPNPPIDKIKEEPEPKKNGRKKRKN